MHVVGARPRPFPRCAHERTRAPRPREGNRTSLAHESTRRCRSQRDRRADGLLPAARTLGARAWRLPRVTMLIQYLYRDEVELHRFQTGLVFADGRWKPSLQGFRLPFAQMDRRGERAVVWGQIRGTRPGRKPYRLEVLRKNVWKPVGRARLTNDTGVFIRTIRLKPGALLRIWSPRQRRYSLQLRVR